MSAHESMEQAEHAEHASGENRKIALLIAVIALFLALSETLGKGAQTESIAKNVEASNLWAFFQAKSIRRTVVQTVSDQARLSLGVMGDDAAKAALQKQIEEWQKTAARYRSEPETGEGIEATIRTRQTRRGRARPRNRQVSSLRARLRRLSDRHRAGFGNHHHRHDRAGLDLRPAGAGRPRLYRARDVRAARAASGLVRRPVALPVRRSFLIESETGARDFSADRTGRPHLYRARDVRAARAASGLVSCTDSDGNLTTSKNASTRFVHALAEALDQPQHPR